MKLESLLKPIRYLDESIILRQYTKLGQKIKIDEGKRKYWAGFGLWTAYVGLTTPLNKLLFGTEFYLFSYLVAGYNDGAYNFEGILNWFKEEDSESRVIDKEKNFRSKYNSCVRLPTFLFGVGLIGKFGVDLVNSVKNKTPIGPESYYALINGLGHLSLASSMYLKETNPKLLERVPLWKRAYESLKEKINLLTPSPIPSPTFSFQENQ